MTDAEPSATLPQGRVGAGADGGVLRVAVLNDFDVIVESVTAMLVGPGVEVVETAVGTASTTEQVDVAVFDRYGRVGSPDEPLRDLLANPLVGKVVVLSFTIDAAAVERALSLGVAGYLWKGLDRAGLVGALQRVAAGEQVVSRPGGHGRAPADGYAWPFGDLGLTAKESEVLALVTEGLHNRAIAGELGVGAETVKSHLRAIYRKLGVHSRTEAAARALRDERFGRRERWPSRAS